MTDEEKSFVIKDKRRFDSQGNEKSAETAATAQAERPKVAAKTEQGQAQSEQAADYGSSENQVTFATFVMSLAMQTLMQLGEIAPPDGAPISRDKQAARQSIDILNMLKEKTKGNLSAEEANMLEEILHNLRISFIKA